MKNLNPYRRLTAAAATAVLIAGLTASPALAEVWVGTDGNDTHSGTERADVLRGGEGRDTLYGRGGADEIYGGNGNDNLYGGAGDDVIRAFNGRDNLYGGDGNDELHATDGTKDLLVCGNGRDVAYADWKDTVSTTCEQVIRTDITYADLTTMFGSRVGPKSVVTKGLPSLNRQMRVGDINNSRRASAFLATLVNESRVQHNALQPGSSAYRGRGYMQLTGDFNYRAAGNALGVNLIASPDKARSLAWSAKIARWYWKDNRHANGPADAMDMGRISKLIGYASSEREDRERCEDFKRAMKHLSGTRPSDGEVRCLRH